MIEIDRNGRKLPVYIAAPEAPGKHRAVIVVHEIFGLDEHHKDVARRFANEGFVAYAPDLFAGYPGLPDDQTDLAAMRAVWSKIPDSNLIADMQAVFELAKKDERVQRDEIGAIGYCMGGAIALMFGASTPGVAWIGDYYGRVFYPQLSAEKTKHPIEYIDTLTAPVIGLFAGQDEHITADHVAQLKQKVEEKNPASEFKIYENAKHAFFNDQREFYNENAAKDAWKRTLEFAKK
jgi:carboxymethylenebutenolidase